MEEAIRDACRDLKTVDLRDRELYTSCEPIDLTVRAHGEKIRGPTREIR
jgi:hypothetical protein